MYEPFNERLDKITKDELVGDILDKLRLTYPVADSTRTYFESGVSIPEMIIKQISLLPPQIVEHYKELKCATLHIEANTRGDSVSIAGLTHGKVIYALSTRSGEDVKDFIHTHSKDGITIFTINSTIPFINDDIIKIYAI